MPADNHLLAGLQAALHYSHVVQRRTADDGPVLGRVIRLDKPGKQPLRVPLHSRRRDGHRVLQRLDQHAGMDEFARPQALILVGKRGLEPDRARGLVDLVVDQKQLALAELVSVVLIERRDLHLALCHGVLHRR